MNTDYNRRNFIKGSAAVVASTVAASKALAQDSDPAAIPEALNVALIGCGGRGMGAAAQILAVDNGVRLVAVADVFEDKSTAAQKRFSGRFKERAPLTEANTFSGFDAYKKVMAMPEVDVVLLATPPHFRPEHMMAAAKAGKHIFAEKPLATDPVGLRKAMEAIKLCKEKQLHFLCGFCYRYDGKKPALYEKIQEGIIGDIVNIQSSYNAGGLWHRGQNEAWSDMEYQLRNWLYFTWLSGDHIVEQAIHGVDKISWLAGDSKIKEVLSLGGRISRTDPKYGHIYDHFAVRYTFENGIVANHTCRQQAGADNETSEWAYGTKGKVDFQGGAIYNTAGEVIFRPKGNFEQMHQHEQRVLIESLRSGTYHNNGDASINSCGMGILARMSAYTGKKLGWDYLLKSSEDLSPASYDMAASIPDVAVAQPGITPLPAKVAEPA